jgi:hypothetical protein
MKYSVRSLLLLVVVATLVGLATAPAFAAELRVTGFIDNTFPHYESNLSAPGPQGDADTTRASDQATWGRTRGRTFFNFIASDDLRGVFGFEFDQTYGAPRDDRAGSGCVEGTGPFQFEQCGFRNGIDTNSFELKQLYVDFRIPQVPIGNRTRLGGLPVNVTPIHSPILYTMDAGGGDTRLDFTDQVSLMVYYVQLEEDLDRFVGSTKIGEDYLTGATLLLKPLPGLDFHIVGLYGHGQTPFGPALTGTGGPFNGIASDSLNVRTESRYYLGFDARYRIGNTSIEPSFIYLLGTRKFSTASAAVTGTDSVDFNAFQTFVTAFHTTGPWLLGGRIAYVSGDSANANLNNTALAARSSNINGFRTMGVDGSHYLGEWFEIMGKSDVDGTSIQTFRRMGEVATLDRFGWAIIAGKAEYKLTDNLTLEGAAGGFWTAKKTGCPSQFQVAPPAPPCTGSGFPENSSDEPALNFTADSRFVGWEVAAGVRYTILPGLTWTPRLAFADYGDATATNNRSPGNAWSFSNRMIYIFEGSKHRDVWRGHG